MDDNNKMDKFYSNGNGPREAETPMQVSAARAMMEVQGQIAMAKKFPRDEIEAIKRIERACSRPELAKKAQYNYPKGKNVDNRPQMVSGPSIRLAETIAQAWGNLDFGIRELAQDDFKKETVMEAYCWDLETNTRQAKVFTVKHGIKTKQGFKEFDDPRDIYEIGANMGARRMRSCVLAIIPADIVELAVARCNKTVSGDTSKPFADRVRDLCIALDREAQVTVGLIEEFLGYSVSDMTFDDFADLYKIYNSLRDKVTKRSDWFGKKDVPVTTETKNLNELSGQKTDTLKNGGESLKNVGVSTDEAVKNLSEMSKAATDERPSFTLK